MAGKCRSAAKINRATAVYLTASPEYSALSDGTLIAEVFLSLIIRDLFNMLISAKYPSTAPLPKRTDEKTIGAANELESAPLEMQIKTVKASDRTMAVIAEHLKDLGITNKTAGHVDEAFAKTRVMLQAAAASNALISGDNSALVDLKEQMSQPPEQRLRPNIAKELGLAEENKSLI